MTEFEDHTESLREKAMETAEEQREKWTLGVALTTAIIAVFAAISGLLAGHHANEGVLEQIRASDNWAYYQSKSIKAEVWNAVSSIYPAMGKPIPEGNEEKKAKYEKEKEKIKEDAEKSEKSSESHMHQHIVFSRAVTIFQVAIAISAIAILTRKKALWYVSLLLAGAGGVFLVLGFLAT